MGSKKWLFRLAETEDRKGDSGKVFIPFKVMKNTIKLAIAMATQVFVYILSLIGLVHFK